MDRIRQHRRFLSFLVVYGIQNGGVCVRIVEVYRVGKKATIGAYRIGIMKHLDM